MRELSTNELPDATTALRAFRRGSLSPLELLDVMIARAERHNGWVNAFSECFYEQAREAAGVAEQRYCRWRQHPQEELPPLLGLPVVTKEKHALAGYTHTQGLVAKRQQYARDDQILVQRIREAGGIIQARTTMPEFSCATVTHSPLWGVTRNPWNKACSPGGSSGGAAAALAAGFTSLATGSDIAGSARIPAAFSGCVGYKPPFGRVPGAPPLSCDNYRADAPMARSVADCALLLNVINGADGVDHMTLPAKKIDAPVAGSLAGLRIALCIRLGNYPVGAEVEAQTRSVAGQLEAAGAVVHEVTLPWNLQTIHATAFSHFGHILAPHMRDVVADIDPDTLAAYTRQFIADALDAAEETRLIDALETQARMQAELAAVMENCDALLCPASATTSMAADGDYLDGIQVNGVRLDHYWQGHMTLPFNITSRCPVLTLPAGLLQDGMPCGVQLVGQPYDDASVFAIGAAIEQLHAAPPLEREHARGDHIHAFCPDA